MAVRSDCLYWLGVNLGISLNDLHPFPEGDMTSDFARGVLGRWVGPSGVLVGFTVSIYVVVAGGSLPGTDSCRVTVIQKLGSN